MRREPSIINERLERLMSRKLDGELRGDESLELNKALIRSPEARHYHDELEQLDGLAADAVRSLRQPPAGPPDIEMGLMAWRRWMWRAGWAAAAAVALVVGIGSLSYGIRDPQPIAANPDAQPIVVAEETSPPIAGVVPSARVVQAQPASNPMGFSPPRRVIGVLDDHTQRLYLLDMSGGSTAYSPPIRVRY